MNRFINTPRSKSLLFLTAIIFLLFVTLTVNAQDFNLRKLLMPGDLGQSHADLESDCQNCHATFDKSAQSRLCLDCHDEIQQSLNANKGFHSKANKSINGDLNCMQCHTDHHGRDNSLTLTTNAQFDHSLTNFRLEGAHQAVSCNSCHKAGKTKLDTQQTCIQCHRNDDIHHDKFGDKCDSCHTPKNWREYSFDHSTTPFNLRGAHLKLECAACHVNQRYEGTPTQCNSCHALDDIHKSNRGQKCGTCHSEEKWDEYSFDHATNTDFSLEGAHDKLHCNTCHRGEALEQVAGTQCFDCHRDDDIHIGQRGTECGSCHRTDNWLESSFDHSRSTDFPLMHKHADLPCASCHADTTDELTGNQCIDCHRSQDIHQGAQGSECQRCHNDSGWTDQVVFDHDITRFPLIGLHAITPCEQCHVNRPFNKLNSNCVDCHKYDDEHQRTLGQQCDSCHTPNGWSIWIFDHNLQTNFELDGKHEGLSCKVCHKKPTKKKATASTLCVTCHRSDDAHEGEFGQYCSRCHTTTSFGEIRP